MVLWIFRRQKTNKARDAPQSAAALNIPVRGWCQSACLSHQACPPLFPRLHLSSSPPSDFSACLWQVISCCRGNITGRPAGCTLGSGILPRAVLCINTRRSLAGFGSRKPSNVGFFFLRRPLSFCHSSVSPHAVLNLRRFIFRRLEQTRLRHSSPCYSCCCSHVQTDFIIHTSWPKKKKKKRFLLITVSNQRLDGKHCRRCHAQNKDNNTHPSL